MVRCKFIENKSLETKLFKDENVDIISDGLAEFTEHYDRLAGIIVTEKIKRKDWKRLSDSAEKSVSEYFGKKLDFKVKVPQRHVFGRIKQKIGEKITRTFGNHKHPILEVPYYYPIGYISEDYAQIFVPSCVVEGGREYVSYVFFHEFVHAFQELVWKREMHFGEIWCDYDNYSILQEGMAVYVQCLLVSKDPKIEALAWRRGVKALANTIEWLKFRGKKLPEKTARAYWEICDKHPYLLTKKASVYDKGFAVYYTASMKYNRYKHNYDVPKEVLMGNFGLLNI